MDEKKFRDIQAPQSKSRCVRDVKEPPRAQTADLVWDKYCGFPGHAGIQVIPRPVGKGFL